MHVTSNGFSLRDRYTLIQASNLFVVALGCIAVVFKLMSVGIDHPPYPTAMVALAGLGNFLFLIRSRNVVVAAWVLITIMVIVLLIFAGYNSGAYGGPILTSAPLIPVLAIVLINGRAGIFVFVAVSVILASMLFLQLEGIVPENVNNPEALAVGKFLAVILTSGVCTIVVCGFASISRNLLVEIKEQANTDPLTGLHNRRLMELAIHSEISRGGKSGLWLSLIMIDVDNFRKFNDANGHPAGDACLIKVAEALQSCANRSLDMVGRIGGEEFIVLLPETNEQGALVLAEKIRQSMLDHKIPYALDNSESVSLTLGVVSEKCDSQIDIKQLIDRADKALYLGKQQGKNQVNSWFADSSEALSTA